MPLARRRAGTTPVSRWRWNSWLVLYSLSPLSTSTRVTRPSATYSMSTGWSPPARGSGPPGIRPGRQFGLVSTVSTDGPPTPIACIIRLKTTSPPIACRCRATVGRPARHGNRSGATAHHGTFRRICADRLPLIASLPLHAPTAKLFLTGTTAPDTARLRYTTRGRGERRDGPADDEHGRPRTAAVETEPRHRRRRRPDRPGRHRRARRLRRPRPGIPQRHRPHQAAHRGAGGRPRQADRGRPLRRGEAGRRHGPPTRAARRPARSIVGRGPGRQGPPAGGEPAARGQHRQAVHRPRHGVPGPHPGRQPRPDPRRREVRLHQGLQVLHLRHLVDPPGHHPRHGRPGPHHPHPGAHGRAGQPDGPGPPRPGRPRSAASPPSPRSPPRWACRVPGHRADLLRPRAGQPRPGRRRGRRERARRLRRRASTRARSRPTRLARASCATRSRSCWPPCPSGSRR